MLEMIYKDHLKWINTVKKMGANQQDAEDIVGEMYVKVGKLINKGLVRYYKGEVNYFYIYRALRNTYLNMVNKRKSESKLSLKLTNEIPADELVDFELANNIVQEELEKMHWYNRKVYEMVQGGYKISELSRKTNIDYYSLYHTYVKTKNKLTNKILE